MEIFLILIPILMAALNRIRGSGMPKWFPLFKNGGPIGAVGTAAVFGVLTMNPIVALGVGIAYFIGELFPWGKWISAMPHVGNPAWQGFYNDTLSPRKDGRKTGIHQIANAFFKETGNFSSYCIVALFLRGVYWWFPVYAVLVLLNAIVLPVAVVSVVMMGILFPLSFIIASKVNEEMFWEWGEYIYGFTQGLVISAGMYIMLM